MARSVGLPLADEARRRPVGAGEAATRAVLAALAAAGARRRAVNAAGFAEAARDPPRLVARALGMSPARHEKRKCGVLTEKMYCHRRGKPVARTGFEPTTSQLFAPRRNRVRHHDPHIHANDNSI